MKTIVIKNLIHVQDLFLSLLIEIDHTILKPTSFIKFGLRITSESSGILMSFFFQIIGSKYLSIIFSLLAQTHDMSKYSPFKTAIQSKYARDRVE